MAITVLCKVYSSILSEMSVKWPRFLYYSNEMARVFFHYYRSSTDNDTDNHCWSSNGDTNNTSTVWMVSMVEWRQTKPWHSRQWGPGNHRLSENKVWTL